MWITYVMQRGKWKQMHECHFENKTDNWKFKHDHPDLKQHCPNLLCGCTTANKKFGFAVLLKVCPYSHEINSCGIGVSSVTEHQERKYCYRSKSDKVGGKKAFPEQCDVDGYTKMPYFLKVVWKKMAVLAEPDLFRMAPNQPSSEPTFFAKFLNA